MPSTTTCRNSCARDNVLPICEQLEDPKKTKKIVKRGVIELVTPGVSYNENTIDNKNNVFLAAVYFTKTKAGLSLLDLSTGEFLATEGSPATMDKILNSFQPKEVLYPKVGSPVQRNFRVKILHLSHRRMVL